MFRLLCLCGLLLLTPDILEAQVHPCDVTPPTNPQLTSPVKGAFCHAGLDAEGQPTTVTLFRLYIDDQVAWQGLLTPIGPPTTDGRFYFETPAVVVSRGNHVAEHTAVSADGESARSAPFIFGVVGAVPAAPTNGRVKK